MYDYVALELNILYAGNYQQALQCYKQIHKQFPENVDCLRFMVRLCSDLGLKEAQEYSLKLRKAEKAMEAKRQRELSSGSGKSSGGSSGSRGHGSTTATSATVSGGLGLLAGSNRHRDRVLSGESGRWKILSSEIRILVCLLGSVSITSKPIANKICYYYYGSEIRVTINCKDC